MAEREGALFKARLAEKAKRYDDLLKEMKSVALMDVRLTEEEMILLYLGYKKAINYRRDSCTKLSLVKEIEESKGHQVNAEMVRNYIGKVQAEINQICDEFNSILSCHVIPANLSSPKDCAIFYEIIGNSYQFRAGDDRIRAAQHSLLAYQTGSMMAELMLPVTHPARLRLAVALQILYYTVFDLPERAYEVATKAINIAHSQINEMDSVGLDILILLEKNHRVVIQRLRLINAAANCVQ